MLVLALLGCHPEPSLPPVEPLPPAPAEPEAAVPPAPAASTGCVAPPAAFVTALGPGRSLVAREAFVAPLVSLDADWRAMRPQDPPMLCPVVRGDLDADGDDDIGALTVGQDGATGLIVGWADGGAFRVEALRSFPRHPDGVYTALWLKPAGDPGPLDHDNFSGLQRGSAEAGALTARAGLVVCLPAQADAAGLPAAIDDSLCYGEETWTWADGRWKAWQAWD